MKRMIFLPFIVTMLLTALLPVTVHAKSPVIIAVNQVIEHPALDATRQGIYDGLKEAGYEENKTLEWHYESAQGNPALAFQISQKFLALNPHVVVGISTISAQSLQSVFKDTKTPIVFSSVTDPAGAKLITDPQKVTGASNWLNIAPQLKVFKTLLPQLKTLGVIYNPGEPNSTYILQQLTEAALPLGIQIITAPATKTSEVGQAAQSLVHKVDALYVSNDNIVLAAFESLVQEGLKQKIPTLASDIDLVARGAFAAVGPNQYELGRQTAKIIIKILEGTPVDALPVYYPEKVEVALNHRMGKILGLEIPDSIAHTASTNLR